MFNKTKIIMFILTLIIAMQVMPSAAVADTFYANDNVSLQLAINQYETAANDMEILVRANFYITDALSIPSNDYDASLTIRSENVDNPVTLTRNVNDRMFYVSSGAKLILENIIIDGNKDAYSYNPFGEDPLVYVNNAGGFTINAGVVLTNNYDSGVYVYKNGIFTMTGGEISNVGVGVHADSGTYADSGKFTFTMTGGEINSNAGAGVYLRNGTLTFTMTGGKINSNCQQRSL